MPNEPPALLPNPASRARARRPPARFPVSATIRRTCVDSTGERPPVQLRRSGRFAPEPLDGNYAPARTSRRRSGRPAATEGLHMRNGDTLSLGVGRPAQGDPGGSAPGTCYGFAVRSELSLSALRSAGEGAPLTVTPSGPDDRLPTGPPYIEWRDDADSVYARLYRVHGG